MQLNFKRAVRVYKRTVNFNKVVSRYVNKGVVSLQVVKISNKKAVFGCMV